MRERGPDTTATDLTSAAASTTRALALGRLYAAARTPIVVVGESGTGKTALARWIHATGLRGPQPFVEFTAAEITETLAHSQLFGHERGAFTGAALRQRGYFSLAGAGTLLCDDLHLMPLPIQAVFLRALSTESYRPVGSERDFPVACRIVVGLRESPDALMRAGVLLPDLRYRLGHCVIGQAPLRERREDIAPLAMRFLEDCPLATGVAGPAQFAPDVMPALESAEWPGNVRELRSVVQAAYLHGQADDLVRFDHLPDHVRVAPSFVPCGNEERNARAIAWALWRTGGRVDAAARLVGAHRNTVSKHLVARRRSATMHNAPARIVQPTAFSEAMGRHSPLPNR